MTKVKRVIKKNWDEIGIATALGHFYTQGKDIDMEQHGYVIEALKKSNSSLQDANLDDLHSYVQSLDEDQLPGLASNVKGIAHEIYYVEAENDNGDTVQAFMFEDTNHEDYDIVVNNDDGTSTSFQLKATDSTSYANDAIEGVGADQVILTEELAEKMGVKSSGITNEQLTADVEYTVDQLLEDQSLWGYIPYLSAWSIALIGASLTKRYIKKQIDKKTYVQFMTIYCGAKLSKVTIIIAALSIPGINIVAGALLFLKLGISVKNTYSS
ncbi:hypothetical protein LF817_16440 [Halobacillus sp. A1]|uniref:hypothetical protein n=1 Tax=Halobacillus sp. A1 TaxID=2880262 RepID=UPI0020A673CE|nr:hypothetical protein [Halobacillus sp. A1]MCP3032915.1 hypothetical protein [Halobacillus sp. A1]